MKLNFIADFGFSTRLGYTYLPTFSFFFLPFSFQKKTKRLVTVPNSEMTEKSVTMAPIT